VGVTLRVSHGNNGHFTVSRRYVEESLDRQALDQLMEKAESPWSEAPICRYFGDVLTHRTGRDARCPGGACKRPPGVVALRKRLLPATPCSAQRAAGPGAPGARSVARARWVAGSEAGAGRPPRIPCASARRSLPAGRARSSRTGRTKPSASTRPSRPCASPRRDGLLRPGRAGRRRARPSGLRCRAPSFPPPRPAPRAKP